MTAILTEDVSCNRHKSVRSMPASQKVRDMLCAPFSSESDQAITVNGETCDYTLAFDVDGQEKLLDFTPSPVDAWATNIYREYLKVFRETRRQITITLPKDSVLGQALQARQPH